MANQKKENHQCMLYMHVDGHSQAFTISVCPYPLQNKYTYTVSAKELRCAESLLKPNMNQPEIPFT